MSTVVAKPLAAQNVQNRRKAAFMVFGCTIFGAFAQILFKTGLRAMPHVTPLAVMTNVPLLAGLTLYGISTLLLVLALREGELSLLYPVISLTYAWVTVLSVFWLGETLNVFKVVGILIIVSGVAMLGRTRSS